MRSTGDKKGLNLKKTTTRLTMHNNSCEYPLGRVMLPVTRSGTTHCLRFYVVDSSVTPILGRHSCLGMKLIRILDSDAIHTVVKQSTTPKELFLDKVLKNFRDVFNGIGELTGEYTIHTKTDVLPVVHPPQEPVKQELDAMVDANIIAPVSEPTKWVSSMVVVERKNYKIRNCLDPRDLNKAIM